MITVMEVLLVDACEHHDGHSWMQVVLASYEPSRDPTSTGWRFVRKPTPHASNRQFESQPAQARERYEPTLNARPDPPSGRSVALPSVFSDHSIGWPELRSRPGRGGRMPALPVALLMEAAGLEGVTD